MKKSMALYVFLFLFSMVSSCGFSFCINPTVNVTFPEGQELYNGQLFPHATPNSNPTILTLAYSEYPAVITFNSGASGTFTMEVSYEFPPHGEPTFERPTLVSVDGKSYGIVSYPPMGAGIVGHVFVHNVSITSGTNTLEFTPQIGPLYGPRIVGNICFQ